MPDDKSNASAVDLWSQVFRALAKNEYATLVDPNYDSAARDIEFRQHLKEAGWSNEEAELHIDSRHERMQRAPVTSPGVNLDVEAILDWHGSEIESAMERLGFTSHKHVARGVEPRVSPHAAKIGVIMTNESIVTVGSFLFRFCGLVARAMTRTLHLNPFIWDAAIWDEDKARRTILSAPDLMKYWMQIYISFAVCGTNYFVPFKPSKKNELAVFEQIARAMELFAIAHEYGHHHHSHGREMESEPHVEEFEADQFALKVCYEIEREPLKYGNPYLASGGGGAVMLLALEQLRAVETLIDGKVADAKSHPSAIARIEKMESVALMRPAEFLALQRFRNAAKRLMSVVNQVLTETLSECQTNNLAVLRKQFIGR